MTVTTTSHLSSKYKYKTKKNKKYNKKNKNIIKKIINNINLFYPIYIMMITHWTSCGFISSKRVISTTRNITNNK